MPALSVTSIWPRPRPMVRGSPALKSLGDSPRRAAFSRSTCRSARARSSVDASTTIVSPRRSSVGSAPLKSKRVPASRRAWSRALVSSAGSYSETTSNENSWGIARLGRLQDLDDRRHRGPDAEHEDQQRAAAEEDRDTHLRLVDRLRRRRLVARRRAVEVVDALGPRPLLELVEDRLAAVRNRLAVEVGDRQ